MTWKVKPGKLQEAIDRFLTVGDPLPDGITSIGRYHRSDLSGGVHIVESQSAALMASHAAGWADVLDLETSAAVEDAEAVQAYARVSGVSAQARTAAKAG